MIFVAFYVQNKFIYVLVSLENIPLKCVEYLSFEAWSNFLAYEYCIDVCGFCNFVLCEYAVYVAMPKGNKTEKIK